MKTLNDLIDNAKTKWILRGAWDLTKGTVAIAAVAAAIWGAYQFGTGLGDLGRFQHGDPQATTRELTMPSDCRNYGTVGVGESAFISGAATMYCYDKDKNIAVYSLRSGGYVLQTKILK